MTFIAPHLGSVRQSRSSPDVHLATYSWDRNDNAHRAVGEVTGEHHPHVRDGWLPPGSPRFLGSQYHSHKRAFNCLSSRCDMVFQSSPPDTVVFGTSLFVETIMVSTSDRKDKQKQAVLRGDMLTSYIPKDNHFSGQIYSVFHQIIESCSLYNTEAHGPLWLEWLQPTGTFFLHCCIYCIIKLQNVVWNQCWSASRPTVPKSWEAVEKHRKPIERLCPPNCLPVGLFKQSRWLTFTEILPFARHLQKAS